jgi:protein SPIRAL1 and related proteins
MDENKASQLFGVANVTLHSGPGNNYSRPDGQNVGNFLGSRPSSRVLAAPGGNSSIAFSSDEAANTHSFTPVSQPAPTSLSPIKVCTISTTGSDSLSIGL